jgi:fructose-bisphosphate aldolase class II
MKLVKAELMDTNLPISINLDCGDSFEFCKSYINDCFISVMIDDSYLPFKDNIELTFKIY